MAQQYAFAVRINDNDDESEEEICFKYFKYRKQRPHRNKRNKQHVALVHVLACSVVRLFVCRFLLCHPQIANSYVKIASWVCTSIKSCWFSFYSCLSTCTLHAVFYSLAVSLQNGDNSTTPIIPYIRTIDSKIRSKIANRWFAFKCSHICIINI